MFCFHLAHTLSLLVHYLWIDFDKLVLNFLEMQWFCVLFVFLNFGSDSKFDFFYTVLFLFSSVLHCVFIICDLTWRISVNFLFCFWNVMFLGFICVFKFWVWFKIWFFLFLHILFSVDSHCVFITSVNFFIKELGMQWF